MGCGGMRAFLISTGHVILHICRLRRMEAVRTAQKELADASKSAAALGVIDANAKGSGGWYACIEVPSCGICCHWI